MGKGLIPAAADTVVKISMHNAVGVAGGRPDYALLGSIGQEFGSEMRFRLFLSLGRPRDRCCLFWIRARIRAAVQDSCSEHISDPKGANGKFMNSTPPFGTSAENPGTHDLVRNHMYGYATHIKPQGFTSRPPLLTTNKVLTTLCIGSLEPHSSARSVLSSD